MTPATPHTHQPTPAPRLLDDELVLLAELVPLAG